MGGLALMYGAGAGRGGAGGGGGGSGGGGGPWQCEFCLKYYGSNNSLRNHRSVYHRRHGAEGAAGGRHARGSPRARPLMLPPLTARPTLTYGPPIGPPPTSTPATTAAAAAAASTTQPSLGHHLAPPT